ncbi:MAG: DUF4395 domain-containing protein, partial [Gammaproteobacteria bacterium]|nr:DUF4395 domain-containing protein [Gammaproteobacteria bacterium]
MKNFQQLKKIGLFQFGEVIPDLTIHGKPAPYPVVNERVVRAHAGIMLVLAIIGFSHGFFNQNYEPLKAVVILFFIDFFFRVIIGFKFSILHHLATIMVRKQKPEYTGAIQKRFAWSIGLAISTLMLVLLFVMNAQGPITLVICSICLAFMW